MRLSLVTPEISNCLRRNPLVGVVGTRVDEATSTCVMLSHGVEAHVTNLVREFGDSGYGDASRWSATLRGGRVFERQGEQPKPSSAVTSSEVRWLDLGLSDELSARRSPSRAVELASRELGSLVGAWLERARRRRDPVGHRPCECIGALGRRRPVVAAGPRGGVGAYAQGPR